MLDMALYIYIDLNIDLSYFRGMSLMSVMDRHSLRLVLMVQHTAGHEGIAPTRCLDPALAKIHLIMTRLFLLLK